MKFFFFVLFFFSTKVFAFPEMVRHGYVNCMSCHVSPTGGGLLNDYGRALSQELLSNDRFFFEKKEEKKSENHDTDFLKGSVALPKGLMVGGDVRFLQYIKDNKKETVGRFIAMQADLEMAYSDGQRFHILGTVGRSEPRKKATQAIDYLVSRRHWASVKIGPHESPDMFQFRIGRFYPAYGIYIPEHTIVTRQGLGFDQLQETYNAEIAYLDENWNIFSTYILGRPDNSAANKGEGGSLQISRALGYTNKIGWNILYTTDAKGEKNKAKTTTGAFANIGFSPDWYALSELDFTHDKSSKWGFLNYLKLGWEFEKGMHLFLSQEFSQPSLEKKNAKKEAYSLGLQYFPRVHWDILLAARQERNLASSKDFDSVFWFLVHYYL